MHRPEESTKPRRHVWRPWSVALALLVVAAPVAWATREAPPELLSTEAATAGSAPDSAAVGTAMGRVGVRSEGPLGPLPYGAPIGQRFVFELTVRHRTLVASGGGEGAALEFDIDGGMQQVVLDRRHDELLLGISFPDCAVVVRTAGVVASEAAAALGVDLGRTTRVRLRSDGTLIGYGFDPGVALEHRNWIRTLVAATHCVLPANASTTWEGEEVDATGRFAVAYHVAIRGDDGQPVQLQRTKRQHRNSSGDKVATVTPVRSSTRFDLDGERRWVVAVEHDEELSAEGADRSFTATQVLALRARLRKHDRAGVGVVDPETWDQDMASVDGRADAAAVSQRTEENRFRELLAGSDVDSLVAEILALTAEAARDRHAMLDLRERLAWLLRLDATALARLQDHLAGLPGDHPAVLACLQAIAMAGTDAAVAVLADLLLESRADHALRRSVVLSLHAVQAPRVNLVRMVDRFLTDTVADDGMRRSGLLLLGALTGKAGDADAMQATLLGRQAWAAEQGMLDTWLLALANTGDAAAVAAALPFATHEDAAVRSAALLALGRSPDQAATEALAAALRSDGDSAVRASAAESLARQATSAAITPLTRCLQSESVAAVRLAAIDELAIRLQRRPATAPLVRWLAEHDSDAEVRRVARAALARP